MASESTQQVSRFPQVCNTSLRHGRAHARNPHKAYNFAPRTAAGVRSVSAVADEARSARPTHSFRSQESATARLSTVGAADPSLLTSKSHSLFGWPAGFATRFELDGEVIGQGGNAVVRQVRCKHTGEEYACKSIKKELQGSQWSDAKRAGHLDSIRQEVEVLRRLRGSLNVATLEDVYEDSTEVHIVMELCRGSELVHSIGSRHYSERTVASYMRAVLRTIAQCHSHRILHRDVKPGNFLLLNEDEMSPLKAIDFGLAKPFDPDALPRSDLGLEGTAWYMAPEVLSSNVGPESDVWSAGVMTFQLLTGRFPFDDKRNPLHPAVTKIWQSILGDQLDFGRSYWDGISEEAKDFVGRLLERDPAKRPTAKEALRHAWLGGDARERNSGKQISPNVVQRIQRFGQHSILKRTVLEHIARDMLALSQEPPPAAPNDSATPGRLRSEPILIGPHGSPMRRLFSAAQFDETGEISRQQVLCMLESMGYRLDAREGSPLLDALDAGQTGSVGRAQLAASQIDWPLLQEREDSAWPEAVRRAFDAFDANGDGLWGRDEIVRCLQQKLQPSEVEVALRQAMSEARMREESEHDGIDFDSFMTMLRSNSCDSLDQYDGRMGSSADRLSLLLGKSCRSEDSFSGGCSVESLPEVC